eukprot:1192841-Prorocentrum_minimum.AAC.2
MSRSGAPRDLPPAPVPPEYRETSLPAFGAPNIRPRAPNVRPRVPNIRPRAPNVRPPPQV